MTSDRWRQIEQVYHAALERDPQERAAYLAEACRSDTDLRKEVESLLAQDVSSPEHVFNRSAVPPTSISPSAIGRFEIGARIGPYEIESPLGAGGMGEVWRARDTRLHRPVAIKISKTGFSRRFELEARAVAALNHPHICTLYDVGPNYLVMEFVNGKPLQEVVPRKGLPLSSALDYAAQIADALAAAHAAGIVHRDLKPGNILITPEGSVKVVDFGLARVTLPDAQNPDDPNPLTAQGQIVGTVSYMSPEQAEGQPVDARSDIFSFGSVLYEMLTGARAFRGSSVASTLGEIIHKDPRPATEIAGPLPRDLETILSRCLRKDPARRWQSIADVKVALLDLKEDSGARESTSTHRPTRSASFLSWTLAAAGILTAAALAYLHFGEKPLERPLLQYTLPLPEKTSDIREFALSPDGHYLVMDAGGEGSPYRLWLRPLDALHVQPLAGTEEATYPFWSPDSRWIAFFTGDKLKKISVNGGPVQTLCDAPTARGGTWGASGEIVFAPNNGGNGLSRVDQTGSSPVQLTKPELGDHRWPSFLPDGRRFLYLATRGKSNGIHLASLDSPEDRLLTPDQSNPAYVSPSGKDPFGLLMFVRERTLMAQPVNPKTLQPKGEFFPVAEQVARGQNIGSNLFSLSETGVLVYDKGSTSEERQYAWFDRNGNEVARVGGVVRSFSSFSVSPDGKRLASVRWNDSGSGTDLWLTDLEHGPDSRLTFESGNGEPVWSPDGAKLAFQSGRGGGVGRIYLRASDNTGADELLFGSSQGVEPLDWSRDGKYIIFQGRMDLWALPLVGPRIPIRLVASGGPGETEAMGQISPDGRWLAYLTNASGVFQVMVQAFAPTNEQARGAKWQISTGGGTQPRWRGDGKELYYMAPDGKLMAVDVKAAPPTFEHGIPHALFQSRADAPTGAISWSYVPSSDGKRFLIRTPVGAAAELPTINVIVNWLAGAKK